MADPPPPVRELQPAVRHQALALIETSLRDEPIVWKLGSLDERELRDLVVACVGLAAVFARGSAAGRGVSAEEVVAWVRARI